MKIKTKYFVQIFLIILFLAAVFLRGYLLKQNLFFGPEEGVDFSVIKELVLHHKITLIGAKTDINGIFHGPIYYYVLELPFLVSHGDPYFMLMSLVVLNSLNVFFIYLLGKKFFNERTGIISAVLFTVAFNAIIYSRWLSTHPLAIPLACLYFLFLIRFIKGKKWDLIFASITFGLLTQSEFLNLLFFSVITFFIVILFFKSFKKQNLFYLFCCLLLAGVFSVGPFLIFDLRHQFLITKNILTLLKGESGYHVGFLISFTSSLLGFLNLVAKTVSPFSLPIAALVLAAALSFLTKYSLPKNKYVLILFFWLFIPPLLLILLRHQILDQFFVSLIPAVIVVIAFLIDNIWNKFVLGGIVLVAGILILNGVAYATNIPTNQQIFFQSTQPNLKYSDELQVIDRIYQEANHQPFSFQAYTIPYWSQQGWQYLFWSYGLRKYGYLPIDEKARTLFVIIQDDPSDKAFQDAWLKNTVSKWGTLKKKFHYGVLTVEELHVVNL